MTFFACFGPAFGDSDNEDNDLEVSDLDNDQGNAMQDVCPDDEVRDPVIPNPPMARLPAPRPPAFDMMDFMHKTSSYDIMEVFRLAEAMPLIPVHVPCERPGGEARRAIMKARAASVPRSLCETFAYATSRTISADDAAIVLETFANVR